MFIIITNKFAFHLRHINNIPTISIPIFTPQCSLLTFLNKSLIQNLKSEGGRGSLASQRNQHQTVLFIHELDLLYRPVIVLTLSVAYTYFHNIMLICYL